MRESKRKMAIRYSFILFFTSLSLSSGAQHQTITQHSILFYNVENLFDTHDDPQSEDESYTPEGELHWTNKRLSQKLLNLSKVILSASDWNVPDIAIFAEIENKYVLEKLIHDTPLKSFAYKIIHKDSPDHRGIDVGLIYNSASFSPIEYNYYPLEVNNTIINTRELLYVSGVFNDIDTIHIFGNHWPSRYSGLLETKDLRKAAAILLREKVDELNLKYISPKIVIVGDFNDNPDDETLSEVLMAGRVENQLKENSLYNLFFDLKRDNQGSLKYQSQWYIFDQIIVSGSLILKNLGLHVIPENAKILALPYLLEDDNKFGGKKPFRTYYGFTYNGGFSDHLPILLQLNSAD